MRPRRTERTKTCLELPGGNEDNFLWMEEAVSAEGHSVMVSYWEPNEEERAAIAAGKKICLLVWGGSHPPVAMAVDE